MLRSPVLPAVLLAMASAAQAAAVTDLTQWSLVQDPPDAGMTASVTATTAVLEGNGPVPSGTDIGYASVDGAAAAASTSGFYFDPSASFSVAIDFDLLTRSTIGGAAIGFGIGEDRAGTNSAGIVLGELNGAPVAFTSAGRAGDVDLPLQFFGVTPAATFSAGGAIAETDGRFFLSYEAATKDVIVGVSTTPGAAGPAETRTLAGIASGWGGDALLVSFFLRSQGAGPIPALQTGLARGTFRNFEVLSGTPRGVPEPASSGLLAAALLSIQPRRMRGA